MKQNWAAIASMEVAATASVPAGSILNFNGVISTPPKWKTDEAFLLSAGVALKHT